MAYENERSDNHSEFFQKEFQRKHEVREPEEGLLEYVSYRN